MPVPRHWSQKRAYLQGKRGIEKPPFKLPDYIEATGITDMRDAYLEKQAQVRRAAQGATGHALLAIVKPADAWPGRRGQHRK